MTNAKTGALHHVELYVADLDETLEFWRWFLRELGYELHQQWDGGESWRLDDCYLAFVQAPDRYATDEFHRCTPGLNHLAFHASSRDHVDRMTEKLRNRGVEILYEDRHPHAGGDDHYAAYFEDPNRLKVELVAL